MCRGTAKFLESLTQFWRDAFTEAVLMPPRKGKA